MHRWSRRINTPHHRHGRLLGVAAAAGLVGSLLVATPAQAATGIPAGWRCDSTPESIGPISVRACLKYTPRTDLGRQWAGTVQLGVAINNTMPTKRFVQAESRYSHQQVASSSWPLVAVEKIGVNVPGQRGRVPEFYALSVFKVGTYTTYLRSDALVVYGIDASRRSGITIPRPAAL